VIDRHALLAASPEQAMRQQLYALAERSVLFIEAIDLVAEFVEDCLGLLRRSSPPHHHREVSITGGDVEKPVRHAQHRHRVAMCDRSYRTRWRTTSIPSSSKYSSRALISSRSSTAKVPLSNRL